ncbi:MAG: DUF5665 domain-containing protein [Candidatus Saccharibacteria bacterium]
MIKQIPGKIVKKVKNDNERGARQAILEDLFYDFHRHRFQVYWMNFVRGIYFGLGSLIGATVVVAILVWILGQFTGYLPEAIGQYIQQIVDAMQKK